MPDRKRSVAHLKQGQDFICLGLFATGVGSIEGSIVLLPMRLLLNVCASIPASPKM